jgi:hypothetical protein
MPGLQKFKVFANANVVGLERELNNWLRSSTPTPDVKLIQLSGWGTGEGVGEYMVVCVIQYQMGAGHAE